MTIHSCRFILSARHPDYGCPAFETAFTVDRLDDLRAILGDAAADDPELDTKRYHLDPAEVPEICRKLGVSFDPGERETTLFKWEGPHPAPCRWHDGGELILMVDRRKPFFRLEHLGDPPHQHEEEDLFDRFVAEGLLHKEEERQVCETPIDVGYGRPAEGMRTVTYVLKGEEWRIPAWNMMKRVHAKSGWNETIERFELLLQGYEEGEIDRHLDQLRQRKVEYGTILAYVAVDAATLAVVDRLGCQALPLSAGPLKLFSAFSEEPEDEKHRRRLLDAESAAALLRLRAKAAPFLDLVDDRHGRDHDLPADRIEALNRLVVEPFEIVLRR